LHSSSSIADILRFLPRTAIGPISVARADGVPVWIDPERTLPHAVAAVRGPNHEQLRALAEGRSAPLTLEGRYRVERRIGSGATATVYAGRLLTLDRAVAIKILHDGRGHHDQIARFVAEARTTAHLRHPNIVEVFDFGSTEEGVVFMVMELLEGEEVRSLIRREGPLPWPRVQALMLDICRGLSAVHAAGVVHRDIKPANCFCANGRTKLLDFGIATHPVSPRVLDSGTTHESAELRALDEGRVMGTPEYMSPEQARAEIVDARSDIYSAGILFGELLTGRVPFSSTRAAAVIASHIYDPAPTLRDLGGENFQIVPGLEAIYASALRKDRDERFSTVELFAAAIAAVKPSIARFAARRVHPNGGLGGVIRIRGTVVQSAA
jgi:serine/threonine protein kinase